MIEHTKGIVENEAVNNTILDLCTDLTKTAMGTQLAMLEAIRDTNEPLRKCAVRLLDSATEIIDVAIEQKSSETAAKEQTASADTAGEKSTK